MTILKILGWILLLDVFACVVASDNFRYDKKEFCLDVLKGFIFMTIAFIITLIGVEIVNELVKSNIIQYRK